MTATATAPERALHFDENTEDEIRAAAAGFSAGYDFEALADQIAQTIIDNAMAQFGYIRRPFTPEIAAAVRTVTGTSDLATYPGLDERLHGAFLSLREIAYYRAR